MTKKNFFCCFFAIFTDRWAPRCALFLVFFAFFYGPAAHTTAMAMKIKKICKMKSSFLKPFKPIFRFFLSFKKTN